MWSAEETTFITSRINTGVFVVPEPQPPRTCDDKTLSYVLGHVCVGREGGGRGNKEDKHTLQVCRYHLGYTRRSPYFIPDPVELGAWAAGSDTWAGLNIMGMLGGCWLAAGSVDLDDPPSPNSWAWKMKPKQGWSLCAVAKALRCDRDRDDDGSPW